MGAVLHDAVALAGVGASVEQVKKLAEALLVVSYQLEENVNAGKYKKTLPVEVVSAAPEANDDDIEF